MANLTLLAGKPGLDGDPDPGLPMSAARANPCNDRSALQRRSLLWAMVRLATVWPLETSQQKQRFRLSF